MSGSSSSATRPHKKVDAAFDGEKRRGFTRAVLADLKALERMLKDGMIEKGVRRVGAEQEMFLVDAGHRPAPAVLEVIERAADPHFTTELGRFNLEVNVDPVICAGDGLGRMERQLHELYDKTRAACAAIGVRPVLTGILPTIRKSDLGLDNMTPSDRYQALARANSEMRGGREFEISIKGIDEVQVKHDSVMVEACCASFQVHLQVSPDEFARMYNVAQVLAAPLMAVSANSPLLFGRRLWAETRIALFQQAVDTRTPGQHLRDAVARVNFGNRWVKESVLEIYKEDVARFRALVGGVDLDEDPMAMLDAGQAPRLKALQLHNGTIYRWNRACYGVIDGKPHLRIENRVMPAGPSLLDEMANAAFWVGLMSEMSFRYEDVTRVIDFDAARGNFTAAARGGINAHFTWIEREDAGAQKLVLDTLLPLAEVGLQREAVDESDVKRYLAVIEARVRSARTGARWLMTSLGEMKKKGTQGERLGALVAATIARQESGRPVAEWERARLDEGGGATRDYLKVEEIMTTDLFTVQPDDAVDLVANMMTWERIRHVLVEDREHKLIGLISYRAVMRHLAQKASGEAASIPASDIMRTDVFTVTPHTSTLEAIAFMRRFRVGCLPVVQDDKLVGIVTEDNFRDIASGLIEEKMRGKDES